MRRIVIVGGGIAGLSAAYYISKIAHEPLEVSLLEAGSYWGGKLVTAREDDFVVEGGPDTFIVTKPWALDLCRQLGLDGRLKGTNPEQKNTYILHNGRLHPLPGGLTMMIPTEFGPMIRTGLLSWGAKARMGADFLIPPAARNGDESLGAFVTRRLGRQPYERLIEPLMSGIYAGDGDLLSLQATFPYLRDLELEYGGLVKGALALRRRRNRNNGRRNSQRTSKTTAGSRSIFLTPQTGLAEIVEALVARLQAAEVELRLNANVMNIEVRDKGFRLRLPHDESMEVDGLILATPAYVSGDLLAVIAPGLAADLKGIPYATTATVSLAYQERDLRRPLDGYGYVIPRSEGRQALACTWTSTKFPHRAPHGYALLRVFIGRAGQEDDLAWDEDSLLQMAQHEVRSTLGIQAEPVLKKVYKWDRAMPQYNLGHPARLERISARMETFPSLALAGNGYEGIGIPDCIHSGELAAKRLLDANTG
jgi:oxygen-dependent protoporphyrinogen oxidase